MISLKLQRWKIVSQVAMKTSTRSPLISLVSIVLSTVVLLSLTACGGGGGNPPVSDQAYAVAIQSDGKIVVAGDSYNGGNYQWSVALARYNSNGSLDPDFGTGGKVLTNIGAGARAVAIQSDGKIVAAGSSYDTPYNFVLVRYNSNGSLDTAFGSGGVVLTNLGGGATAVAIQSDNKIVVAGYSFNGSGYDFALARYNSNGTLDAATFGNGNGAVFDFGGGALSVAIQADGKILAAGGSYIYRYDTFGYPDLSFGSGTGKVTTGSYYDQTSGVGIQADGQILAAGSSYNGTSLYDLALTRYNNIDGSADTSFASTGTATTSAMSYYNLAKTSVVPLSSSNTIIVAGFSQDRFVLARYNSDGTPDTTFNIGGALLAAGGSYWNYNSTVQAIAVQTNGSIVIAGSSYKDDTNGNDFALARLVSNGSIDTAFGTNGSVTTGF